MLVAGRGLIIMMIMMSRETLTKLDIDHSSRVSDAATTDLLQLTNLVLLSMAGEIEVENLQHFAGNYLKIFPPKTMKIIL